MAGPAGVRCAYCHTAIREHELEAQCSECGTVLHAECWEENGGCVLPGCEGHGMVDEAAPSEGGGAAEPPPAGGGRGVLVAAFSILGLAAVLIAVAVGAKLLGGSDSATATATKLAPADTTERAPKPDPDARQAAAVERDIKKVFRQIDKGHWQATIPYLAKPEIDDLAESGDPAYVFRLAYTPHDLVGNIQPNRLSVSRVQVDGREAEFQLAVPYDDRRCFKGVTWAQREGGHWRYDPSTYNRPGRGSLGRHGMRVRPNGC